MSVERAIENLIKELRNHRGRGRGVDDTGPSDSSTGTDSPGESPSDRRAREQREGFERDRERQEEDDKAQGKFTQYFKNILTKGVQGVRSTLMTEIKAGVTLEETDINILLSPLNRQLERLRDYKITAGAVFRDFGQTVEDLSVRFGGTRDEMDEFGKSSQRLYGNAEFGYRAYRELQKEFGGFMGLTKDGRTLIGNTVMAMSSLGFETSDVSKVLDRATRSLGMTAGGANTTALRLAKLRQEFNVGAREITQNYILAQDKLIYSSDRVDRVFAELQRTSRISGVEFSTLVNTFGEGFDTFEGAAAKAGGLNALLGGNIFNSLEFLEQDEAQRMGTIVERIRGNVNVNALIGDKFNLKAVAKQLGLNEDQTRRLLLGETSVAQAMESAIGKSGKGAVDKVNAEMTTALDDLTSTLTAARGPLNNALLKLANEISTGGEALGSKFLTEASSIDAQTRIRDVFTTNASDLPFFKSDEDLQDRMKLQLGANSLTMADVQSTLPDALGTSITGATGALMFEAAATLKKLDLVLAANVATNQGANTALLLESISLLNTTLRANKIVIVEDL